MKVLEGFWAHDIFTRVNVDLYICNPPSTNGRCVIVYHILLCVNKIMKMTSFTDNIHTSFTHDMQKWAKKKMLTCVKVNLGIYASKEVVDNFMPPI